MNTKWTSANIGSQSGKTVIITGANSGLGLEAAKVLSQKEATVIMAVRNMDKGQKVLNAILTNNPNAKVELMELDLANIESIRNFANNFKSKYRNIHILLNNAGVMWPPKRVGTKQGWESQFGVNHLGHFALTSLLLDILTATPNSRVVNQSSIAHRMINQLNFNDLNWNKSYSKSKAYAQSKLANLLFTYHLQKKLSENNCSTIAVACHPGVSTTNLFRSSAKIVRWGSQQVGQKAEFGALPMLRAATEEGLKGGEFFGPRGFLEFTGHPKHVSSNKLSNDSALAEKLWEASETLTETPFAFNGCAN